MKYIENRNEKEGYLYAAGNLAMPSFLKVGYTEDDAKKRVKQLSNSSVPYDFTLECSVRVFNPAKAEAIIHKLLAPYRVNKEFFMVDVALVKDLFTVIKNDPQLNKSKNIKKDNTNQLISGQIINIKNPDNKAEIMSKNKILYLGIIYGFQQFINVLRKQKSNLNDWQIGNRNLSELADDLLYR